MQRTAWIITFSLLLVLGVFANSRIDWAAFGPAELPEGSATPDTGRFQPTRLQVGSQDGLAGSMSFTWSQHVPVEAVVIGDPGVFRVKNGILNFAKPQNLPKGVADLPLASMRIQMLRRSSIAPGFRVMSSVGKGARVDKSGKLTWDGRLWIPEVPGDYLMQLILISQQRKGRAQFESAETVIANAVVHVLPQSQN